MSVFVTLTPPNNRQYLQELNSELASYGLASYNFDFGRKYDYDSLPWLQLSIYDRRLIRRLKTIAVELEYNSSWTIGDESLFVDEPIIMDLVTEVFGAKESHFIWQYGFCNCFIPVDFTGGSLAKGCLKTLGSSINLVRELEELAQKLNFNLEGYTPRYTEDYQLYCDEDFEDFANNVLVDEKSLLLELYTIAVASIKNNLIMDIG